MPLVNIDFDKFLEEGVIEEVAKDTENSKICYIVNYSLDSHQIDVLDVKELVPNLSDINCPIIINIPNLNYGEKISIKEVDARNKSVYLNVSGVFSVPKGGAKIIGRQSRDVFVGSTGDDTLNGNALNDILDGGTGNDVLNGGANQDTLIGGDRGDVFDGGIGDDRIIGGAGYNKYYFGHGEIGRDIIEMDPSSQGDDKLIFFRGSKQCFVTIWDHQKQEAHFYLFTDSKDRSSLVYNGKNHITVKGYSDKRKLLVQNYLSPTDGLVSYKIVYRIKGQQAERKLKTFLPKDTEEIFVPANCQFLRLYGPDDKRILLANVRTVTDKTKAGELNKLFGAQ